MVFKFVAVLLLVASFANAQFKHDGECPDNVEVVQNFDVEKYMGKWFEIKRYDAYFQRGSECSQAVYTKSEDGSIEVENSSIKNGQPRSSITGRAILADPTADPIVGQLIVTFNNRQPGTVPNYQILGTDYENWAVVWNCMSLRNGRSADFAWILSRQTTLSADVEESVNAIVDKYLDKERLRVTSQDNETCGY